MLMKCVNPTFTFIREVTKYIKQRTCLKTGLKNTFLKILRKGERKKS